MLHRMKLAAVIAASYLITTTAHAAEPSYNLYTACSDRPAPDSVLVGYCLGFLEGVRDVRATLYDCAPQPLSPTLPVIFTKWAERNPQMLPQLSAVGAAYVAFAETIPCRDKPQSSVSGNGPGSFRDEYLSRVMRGLLYRAGPP